LACVDRVRKATQGRGIWGVDRRGDRGVLFEGLSFRDERFLIRLPGHRNLAWNQQTVLAAELAARQAPPFAFLAPARASPQLTLTGPAPP
jgi:hypothetical protein